MNRNRKAMAKTGAVLLGAAVAVNTMAVPAMADTEAQKRRKCLCKLESGRKCFRCLCGKRI